MSPLRHARTRPARSAVALLAALGVLLLAGCGLRLETPPPPPLTPGVDEVARQRASADAAALGVVAEGAVAGGAVPPADPAADPVGAARAAVAAAAAVHLDLLGGLYDDGLSAQTPSPLPAPTPTPTAEPVPVAPDVVVAELVEAAATARADLRTVTDGGLARLLASVAASRQLAAARLAAAAGLPPTPAPEVVLPAAGPLGVRAGDLAVLVAAEDAAGYALEVVAAKHGGDLRARATARAATHRARAQAWAELGEVDGTGLDPRRVAYALPPGLEDPAAATALAAELETTLAADYASLVATVDPDARAVMADAVAEATAQAATWGAVVPALPGLPEHAGR